MNPTEIASMTEGLYRHEWRGAPKAYLQTAWRECRAKQEVPS
jgi:hypothetical protein